MTGMWVCRGCAVVAASSSGPSYSTVCACVPVPLVQAFVQVGTSCMAGNNDAEDLLSEVTAVHVC